LGMPPPPPDGALFFNSVVSEPALERAMVGAVLTPAMVGAPLLLTAPPPQVST
jgi:hypothetical protein